MKYVINTMYVRRGKTIKTIIYTFQFHKILNIYFRIASKLK